MGLSIKEILFPVQRVAKIEASRAATIFFLRLFFSSMKNEKKSPVAPLLATRPVYRKQNYFYGQPGRHYSRNKSKRLVVDTLP